MARRRLGLRIGVTKRRRSRVRDAACTVVDILGHTQVLSRSFARSLPFLSFSFFFSKEKQLGYLSATLDRRLESAFASWRALRRGYTLAPLVREPKFVRSFLMFLPRGRLVESEAAFARAPHLAWSPLIPEVIGISKCHVAPIRPLSLF